jgi:hypothetical protein
MYQECQFLFLIFFHLMSYIFPIIHFHPKGLPEVLNLSILGNSTGNISFGIFIGLLFSS